MADRSAVLERLRVIGESEDEAIDIAEAALLLAALDRPEESLKPYTQKLAELAAGAKAATAPTHSVDMQLAALNALLCGRWGFAGDSETYDDPRNANLMHVIDRRKGLPVALGILWLHAGRSYGAELTGLAFPSHFLVRLSARGQRLIIDVFNGGKPLGAADMRRLLKQMLGEAQEIEPGHYAPVSARDVLIRLQNNLKVRALGAGDLPRALEVLQSMTLLAPDRSELWRETAVLHSRLGNLNTAIATLERLLAEASADPDRNEIEDLLHRLRSSVN